MTMTNPTELSAIWIATYDGEDTPVPFAYPIGRAEAAALTGNARARRTHFMDLDPDEKRTRLAAVSSMRNRLAESLTARTRAMPR
jgi:hypothetical protein